MITLEETTYKYKVIYEDNTYYVIICQKGDKEEINIVHESGNIPNDQLFDSIENYINKILEE
mgnify:CR=1 FL=1